MPKEASRSPFARYRRTTHLDGVGATAPTVTMRPPDWNAIAWAIAGLPSESLPRGATPPAPKPVSSVPPGAA